MFPRKHRQTHLIQPGGGLAGAIHDLRKDAADALAGSVVSIGAGATYVLTDDDDGRTFYCTGARTFRVDVELSIGFVCAFVNDGGAPTITAGPTLTFLAPASATPPYAPSEAGVTIGVYKFEATRAQLEGSLA